MSVDEKKFLIKHEFLKRNIKLGAKYYGTRAAHCGFAWVICIHRVGTELYTGMECYRIEESPREFSIEADCNITLTHTAENKTLRRWVFSYKYKNYGNMDENCQSFSTVRFKNIKKKFVVEILCQILNVETLPVFVKGLLDQPIVDEDETSITSTAIQPFTMSGPVDEMFSDLFLDTTDVSAPQCLGEPSNLSHLISMLPKPKELKKTRTIHLESSKICLECHEKRVEVRLCCDHSFCYSCIRKSKKCPTCMKNVRLSQVESEKLFEGIQIYLDKMLDSSDHFEDVKCEQESVQWKDEEHENHLVNSSEGSDATNKDVKHERILELSEVPEGTVVKSGYKEEDDDDEFEEEIEKPEEEETTQTPENDQTTNDSSFYLIAGVGVFLVSLLIYKCLL